MNGSNVEVLLFTDGACSGNPGPGGWAFVMRHIKTGTEKEASGGDENTTNNRMELSAVIEGLASLKRSTSVRVVTDSTYVMKGVTEWMKNWKRNGWRRKTRSGFEPVKNDELWKRLDELCQEHQVTWELVKGHSGHPENERCDVLAVEAYQQYLR